MMSEARGQTSRPWNPEHYRHAAHRPEAKLPQADLGFFWLDTVPPLTLSRFYAPYEEETRGAPPFDPQLRVCLLLSAYGVGVFASRKSAQACARNLAFLVIVGEERPAFRPISDFRQLPLAACCDVCVEGLRIAGASGLVQLGNGWRDATKHQGKASPRTAMRNGDRKQDVERLREAIAALVTQASHQDAEDEAALYARRKVIVEPVFGQIKEARGLRRFLLRGWDNIRGEWR